MNRIASLRSTVAFGLVCLHAFTQEAHGHTQTQAPSLCAANEEPVFSCTLQGTGRKMVALCASPASAQGKRHFHYLYGKPSKIELRFPAISISNGKEAFTFTRLRYAGATGGYAHTFINEGYKYILYSIEGTGFEESGLMVQRQGALRTASEMHCRSSTLIKLKNNDLWNETVSKWNVDADIDAHGLPSRN